MTPCTLPARSLHAPLYAPPYNPLHACRRAACRGYGAAGEAERMNDRADRMIGNTQGRQTMSSEADLCRSNSLADLSGVHPGRA